jgi:hypothetical protein
VAGQRAASFHDPSSPRLIHLRGPRLEPGVRQIDSICVAGAEGRLDLISP